ncbi:MAG: hypothetical protein PHX78_04945 [bacterium]|nr:hypothetical protein [bacterium]
MKKVKILISITSIFFLIGFLGCSRTKKVQPPKEEQKGNAWEQDMNKLIEKATPKEGGK